MLDEISAIIARLFLVIVFPLFLHIVLIYENDKAEKKWSKKLKTIDLKWLKHFFIFYKHKEGKISIVPFIHAVLAYTCLALLLSSWIVATIFNIEILFIVTLSLFLFQFVPLIVFIGYRIFKYDSEIEKDKNEQLRLQKEKKNETMLK
jgi:hypothetical protein